jgi:hypothetical protein
MATAMDTPMAHSGITTATIGAGQGIRWIRRLVLMNLGLVALQALSAGFLMSGYGRAVTIHAGVAHALQLGALAQAVAAVVLWRRRRVPAWVARDGIGLVVTVLLQVGLGYTKQYYTQATFLTARSAARRMVEALRRHLDDHRHTVPHGVPERWW